MNAESVHVQRLRSLDFWRGPVEVEPLPGGITNRNFRVHDPAAGRWYVARLCEERPLLGIDRRNEVACQHAAHAAGVGPQVVHHEAGILVSAFLTGRTLTPEAVRDPARLVQVAATLRRLHDGWDRLEGLLIYFSPFQVVRTYAAAARDLGAELPADLDALLEDARGLSRRIAPFVPVLCHNDLLAANLLAAPDGTISLVDWEYAGVGHPLFDLANVAANSELSQEAEVELLRAYRGEIVARERGELRILRAASSLREALWAVIQAVASDLDFDYHAYAREHFAAYRAARGRLDRVGP